MITYKEMTINDIEEMAAMYVETFNAAPWNDEWTMETASKRLHQMINVEDFYGLCTYWKDQLCGIILGCKEEFYNGTMFNIREFCISNELRGQGIGTKTLNEFERRLKSQGVKDIILFTSRENGTEEFYRKRGLESYNGMVMLGKTL